MESASIITCFSRATDTIPNNNVFYFTELWYWDMWNISLVDYGYLGIYSLNLRRELLSSLALDHEIYKSIADKGLLLNNKSFREPKTFKIIADSWEIEHRYMKIVNSKIA